MSSVTADFSRVHLARRAAIALVGGLLLAVPIGQHLVPSMTGHIITGLVLALIVYRTQSVAAGIIIPVAAIAATVSILQIAQIGFSYRIPFIGLAVAIALCACVMVWRWQVSTENKMQMSDVLLVAVVAAVLHFLTRQATWDIREAFAAVSVTGEDNGTWLDGISAILRQDATINSTKFPSHLGVLGTVLASFVVGVTKAFGTLGGTVGDSAVVTMQLYWLLTAVASLLAARITFLLSKAHVGQLSVIPSALAAVFVVLFAQGFIAAGHLTGLLAATFLLATALVLVEKPFSEIGTSLLAVLLLFGAAEAWWPVRGIIFLVLCASVIALVPHVGSLRHRYLGALNDGRLVLRRGSVVTWGLLVAVSALVLVFARYVAQLDGRSPFESFRYAVSLLGVDGAKAEVDPLLAVTLFFFAVVASVQSSASRASQKFFGMLIGSSITFSMVLVAYGFVQPPYAPQYPAVKATYLICLVVTPISISGLTMVAKRLCRSESYAVVVVAAVTIMGSMTYLQPYPRLKNLLVTQPAEFWVDAAVQELTQNPERLVLCLDTREQWEEADGHTCSRLLAGIQGKSSADTSVWNGVNLCWATPAQVAALPLQFWQNLTLVVTNRDRLVSTDECDKYGWSGPGLPSEDRYPLGVLTGVPWKIVRVVGADGVEASKTFGYLRGVIPDEVVDKLEASLSG